MFRYVGLQPESTLSTRNVVAKHCDSSDDCYAYVFPRDPQGPTVLLTFHVGDPVTEVDRQSFGGVSNVVDAGASASRLVAASKGGVGLFDLSDPSRPSLLRVLPRHGSKQPRQVGVNDTRLFSLELQSDGNQNVSQLWIHDLAGIEEDCDVEMYDRPDHSVVFGDFAVNDTWVYISVIDLRVRRGLRRFRIEDLLQNCQGS